MSVNQNKTLHLLNRLYDECFDSMEDFDDEPSSEILLEISQEVSDKFLYLENNT